MTSNSDFIGPMPHPGTTWQTYRLGKAEPPKPVSELVAESMRLFPRELSIYEYWIDGPLPTIDRFTPTK